MAMTMMRTNLTDHFTLHELSYSPTAVAAGIDNTPDDEIIANLSQLAATLEVLRAILGQKPLHITSGYRCAELNALVAGSPTSAHLSGYAADFTCPEYGSVSHVYNKLVSASNLYKFDELYNEKGRWIHFSIAPRLRRRMKVIG